MILFTQDRRHPKLNKNIKRAVLGVVMHLAPAISSGYEVCPMRSEGCTAACLNYAGFQYQRKYNARIKRTRWFFEHREAFMNRLWREVRNVERRALKDGLQPGVRLNGTSDVPWESIPCKGLPNIMAHFPEVLFMDYTKRANRRDLPPNYRLVFSRSESNEASCAKAIENGMNVAVVFRHHLPEFHNIGGKPFRVVDGDAHDWRWAEYQDFPNERIIIGLIAKGEKGRYDASGFVVDAPARRKWLSA